MGHYDKFLDAATKSNPFDDYPTKDYRTVIEIDSASVATIKYPEPIEHTQDVVANAVIDKFIKRSAIGYRKYHQSLEDNRKPLAKWIEDAQEELMDAILYLEKTKRVLAGGT